MSFGVKALMVIAGVVTVAVTTLLLTSRPMDMWMLARGRGQACECAVQSWEAHWNGADAVFTGRVLAAAGPAEAGQAAPLRVTVEKTWKDDRSGLGLGEEAEGLKEGLPTDIAIDVLIGCRAPEHQVGSPYLFLAQRHPTGLITGQCAVNRRWTRLDEMLLALGIGDPPGPPILGPSQVRGPMIVAMMALCAVVVFLIAYVSRDPD